MDFGFTLKGGDDVGRTLALPRPPPPAPREPSVPASSLAVLNELSGGRMDLGIGRGDSARRVLGKPPTSMKDLEQAVHVIRALVEGRSVEFEGATLELPWTTGGR